MSPRPDVRGFETQSNGEKCIPFSCSGVIVLFLGVLTNAAAALMSVRVI